jgi:hypothetical protein
MQSPLHALTLGVNTEAIGQCLRGCDTDRLGASLGNMFASDHALRCKPTFHAKVN